MQKVHVAGGHGYKFEQIYDFSNDSCLNRY